MGLFEYFFFSMGFRWLNQALQVEWLLALRDSAHLAGDVNLCEVLVIECPITCLSTILLYSKT